MKRFRKITIWPWAMILVLVLASPAAAAPNWVQLTPTPEPVNGSPPPRDLHSAVYNQTSNRMIVFGGSFGGGNADWHNDVWVLTNADGTTGTPAWQKLDPVGPPPPVHGSGTARHSTRLTTG
jgi:hypothetical protein